MTDETVPNMAELYARDPMSLTNEDIDFIIADLRKKYQLFNSAAFEKKPKTAATKTLTKAQSDAKKLNLDIKL